MNRPLLAVAGALAGLAVLLGLGAATPPAAPAPRTGDVVPVEGRTLVCPEQEGVPGRLNSRVSAGVVEAPATSTAPSAGASTAPSGLTTSVLGRPAVTPVDLAPGRVATGLGTGGSTGSSTGSGPLVVTGRGALAGGLQAEQVTGAGSGSRRGLEALACGAPQTDWWFAGGSLAPGETTSLELTNPEDTAAVVDVQLWAAQGPVDPRLGRGTVVPPRGRTTLALDTLAPGLTGLALHVTTQRGRVAAAVEHLRGLGATPLGAEWVPACAPPSPRVVLPALPAGPGARSVLVTNPGAAAAVVRVQVTTSDGQFVPTGLEAVQVPAGTTVPVDLTGVLSGTPAAVVVTTDVGAVLAVGLAEDGTGPVRDLSYAGAAAPLDGPALVTDTAGTGSALLLSAVAGDATVTLTPLPVAGQPGPAPAARTVTVPGGSVVTVPLAGLVGPGGAVQVAPVAGSGPVRAVAQLRDDLPDGPRAALLTLVAPVQQVPQPAVQGDPGAALP